MENNIVLGIDIGGSHITAALVDLNTRSVVEGSGLRLSVDSNGTAEEILSSWCKVIDEAFTKFGNLQRQIGMAMPGPFDYESGISLIQDQEKFRSLYRINLKDELSRRLGIDQDDILFINDAAAFLQGEVFCGVAADCRHVLGLTLGTGLGSAICTDLLAVDAALWNSLFKNGIAEDLLSTHWFLDRYFELTGVPVRGVKELSESVQFPAMVVQIFEEFGDNLAEFLFPVVQDHSIQTVVLGGNISHAHSFFMPQVNLRLKELRAEVAIKVAQLKEQASLIGAASCFQRMAYSKLDN